MSLYQVIYNFISFFFNDLDYFDEIMISLFSYIMTFGFICLFVFGFLKIISFLFSWGKK